MNKLSSDILCKLSYKIITVPALSPSGFIFEKNALYHYINSFNIDPISHEKCNISKITELKCNFINEIFNLTLKESNDIINGDKKFE